MNRRVSKIIQHHVTAMIEKGTVKPRDARRARKELKRRYLRLNVAERDGFAQKFTPMQTWRGREFRRVKKEIRAMRRAELLRHRASVRIAGGILNPHLGVAIQMNHAYEESANG